MATTPKWKLQAGLINVTAWENKGKRQDGQEFEYTSFKAQRSYKKTPESDWIRESINLRINELPKLAALLEKMYLEAITAGKEQEEGQ